MTLILAIGIPTFLILGGALLAFTFSTDPEPPETAPSPEATQPAKGLVFFQPVGWAPKGERVSAEELVASIEQHLREERKATNAFLEDPSARSFLE